MRREAPIDMHLLLSTIGSRGDVQPLLALAAQIRALGARATVCAPPDFRDLAERQGVEFIALGREVSAAPTRGAGEALPQRDWSQVIAQSVVEQFNTLCEASAGCDVIVACNQIQVAARSVAELRGIRYLFADYSPAALPSPHHRPAMLGLSPAGEGDNETQWTHEAERRNAMWLKPLNECRGKAGLPSVADVRSHIIGERPLLAADPALAPWQLPAPLDVCQTGAWLDQDTRPLEDTLESFLEAGDPPIYFGFGSMREPEETARAAAAAADRLGRRAIVLRGWGEAHTLDRDRHLLVGETNLQALLPRVAAVVHHGGSGTTTIAAMSGRPQVIVPHHYDQHYFARRVEQLGVGVAHAAEQPTEQSFEEALTRALSREKTARAQSLAPQIRTDGALTAARYAVGKSDSRSPTRS